MRLREPRLIFRPEADDDIASTRSVVITTVQANDRESRYDGSCSDYYAERDKTEHVPVALTSKSFDSVKLCYKDSARTAVFLVAKSDFCPMGTIEQATPIDNCSQL